MKTTSGTEAFKNLSAQLPVLLDQLLACPPCTRLDPQLGAFRGIYLFIEHGKAMYVGRTNNLRRRIRNHTIPGAGHNQATFAFNLAEGEKGGREGLTRKLVEQHPEFKLKFIEAKARVSKMEIKFVKVDDPHLQTVFEVYAALVLGTPHNDFENH